MVWVRQSLYMTLMYLCNRVIARIPSHSIRLAFYRRCMRYEVGARTSILMDAWFDARGRLRIGDHSVINQKCRLDSRGGLSIGSNVSISADVCVLTSDHDVQHADFAGRERPVDIEDYVFIGTRAMILPGVRIGIGAVVAAGAVVTKSVAPYQIVAGVPALVIGQRTAGLRYRLDYNPLFC